MAEVIENDIEELPYQTYIKVIEKMKRKNGDKYSYITKAGASLKSALFNLYKIVWKTEKIPEPWRKSTLIQLFKGKGKRNILSNQRFLHDKKDLMKFLGQLVMHHAKDTMIENMTKFQIACKPGHRASEHLYVIRSFIDKIEEEKKAVILSSFDIEKFFDSESLYDVLGEVHANKVTGKLYRLIHEMNKSSKIKVQTPLGETEEKETGPTVTQGSVEAATLSSVSLDNGVDEGFNEKEREVKYLDIVLAPLLYMDDVFRMATNIEDAQYGNERIREVLDPKQLRLNLEKSSFIVVGNKTARVRLQEELKTKPLMLYNSKMKEENMIKYLGDYFRDSSEESTHQTVLKK